MAAPRTRRDQFIRDLVRDHSFFSEVEGYLRQHLGPEMGALNVKQTEGILILITMVKRMMEALGEINVDMIAMEEVFATDGPGQAQIHANRDEIVLKAGNASIHLVKDGRIDIKGKDLRIAASGDATISSAKDLKLKGMRISEN